MRARNRFAAALLCGVLVGVGHVPAANALIVERIVAVVGDRAILLSELRERARPFLTQILQRVPPGAQQAAAESQVLKELIEKMVVDELEAQAASKARVTVTLDEIDNAIKNIADLQGITVEELYKDAKARSGLSRQEYRDELRRQILEGKMLQLRVKGRVRITEDDIRSMFERTLREERRRLEYRPAWIVLRIMPGSSLEAIAERRALGSELAARARAGEEFGSLAKRYSDDTETRDSGGDLGIRAPSGSQNAQTGRRPTMAPELETALFALEAGQIAGPIQIGEAIMVLKLVNRQASRYTTLDDARDAMMQKLQTEILEKAKRKWIEELKRRTHLDVRL